ncbi:uncharacterized protein [Apostichopus japonicus]|uniref:uncharacterized protein isoform X26 n=1 Tax=Stichopus japonicus TaxID=307972 RepID=UPI003AB1BE5D
MSFIVFTHFVLRIWLSSVVLGLTKGQCSTGECEASYFDPDLVITPNQDCFANHSTVTLSCSVKLGGPPFNTCQNGTWELPSASCDGFTCDPPSVGDSVILTPNKTTYLARETVSFSCGGLNLTGPSDASCGPGGIWEPSTIPVCETFCNVLPEIVNGNVNSTDQIDLGDELDIVCRANYSVPAGEDPFIRCNGEQWSSIPTCYPQCKPLEEPEYGIVSPGLAQGITVNYSCEWGFELNGTRSVECQNATWSVHTTPTCDAKPCFPSFEQQNHLVYEPVNYVYRNGSTVNFSCEGDSRLEGEPFAICLYGNWSNSPDCLESCNVTGVPNSNLTESTLLPDSKSTTVECDNGFTFFEGRSGFDLKCSNGTLSREIPIKCFADCQTVANIPNGHITSSVYHGVTVNISCDPGYLLKGPSTALCDDGNWTPEIVSSCDELSSSTVGSTTVSTVSDGTTPLTNETTPSRADVTTSMKTTSDVTTGLSSSTVGSTTVSTVSDGTPPLTNETTPSRGTTDVTTSMKTTSDVTTGLSSSTVGSTTVSTVSDGTPPLTNETTPSRGTSETDVTTSMETTSDVTTGPSSSPVGSTTVSTVSDGTPPLTNETTPSRAIPCPPPVLTDLNSRIDIELDEYPHETIVTFSCLGDFILKGILTSTCVHGIWVSQNYPTCVAFDSVEEELIEIIETTFTTNTTTEEVRDAAETIQFATSDDSFTRNDPTRLQLIIQSLENVVDTNDVSMNVTTPVINIANNLMEFDESSLLNISGRVVDALEQQISSFQSSGESGNYSLVLNNIGIKTAKLNLNAFGDSFGFGYIFPDEQSPSLDGDLIRDNTRLFASGDKVPDRNTASSISIPKSVLESTGLPALELPVSFAVYTSSKLFMSSNMSKEDRIASQIISAKVEGAPKIEKLPRTSTITAKFLTNVILTKREVITSRKCVFWSYDNDNNEGTWSVEGCTTNIGEFDLTVCSCDHLTSFAILATVEREINWVILIGSIFSTILLILTVCTLASCFRTSRFKQSTFIYINICICLLGLLISYILSFEAVLHDIACGVASAAVHYFCLATVTWLSVDSIHMYLLFVRPAYTAIRQFSSVSCFIAYGLPLLPVILVAVYARIFNTTDPEFCFISDGPTLISGLLIIDVVLLLLSCAMFFFIIRKGLRVSLSVTSQKELMRRMQTYARVRNGILLWLMTILSSAFGYSVYIYPDSYALEYLYAISISVQSLAIFIMFCFANYQNSKQVLKVNATGSQGDVRDGDDDTFGSERAESMDDHIPMNQLGSGMIPRPKICN